MPLSFLEIVIKCKSDKNESNQVSAYQKRKQFGMLKHS